MLRPRWRKVLRDLFSSKTRTLLVVLSIAIGVFAVGIIVSSRTIIERDMNGGLPSALALEIAVVMIVPLLAALYPIDFPLIAPPAGSSPRWRASSPRGTPRT